MTMAKETTLELGPEGEFEKNRLERLIRLRLSDNGFFLLACHSYIESWLRQSLHHWEDDFSFADLIFHFKIKIIEDANGFPPELSVLQNLRLKEKTASAVRHSFVSISDEEAAASAYRLLQFCSLAGIDNEEELGILRSGLESWKERSLINDNELTILRQQLALSKKQNKEILNEIEQLRMLRAENKALKLQIEKLELGGSKQAENKSNLTALKKSQVENNNRISALHNADNYINDLARLTGYTRTRFEYERDITRLTDEQEEILKCINLTDDFLIKGGAGTGKTLVLIKALEKALELGRNELSFSDEQTSVRMLTFNRTLAKYDRYIAELLKQDDAAVDISTIDKYLYDKLKSINSSYRIIFDDSYCEELISETGSVDFMNTRELADEIDGYIFASLLSREEYLAEGRGLKRAQKEAIWETSEKIASLMSENEAFTKNYSRIVILQKLSENVTAKDTDFTFIDEVQDLTAADIKAVKACTRRSVILAGDADQSIYQDGFTFGRAGIDIRGTTRILRKNFRNSCEIQDLAEKYRLKHTGADQSSKPEAFRAGPPPELYTADDPQKLQRLIVDRVRLFANELHYDPENICILVPSSRDIEPLKSALSHAGLESGDLRNDDFSFNTRGIIRISTMHSSKGLDFPVVLLNLHKLPQTAAAGKASREKMRRNLIYVSMTRAMDHLNVFTLANEKSPEICDLTGLF